MSRFLASLPALAFALALAAPRFARADFQLDPQLASQVANRTVDRARRAIAIGPHLGGLGAFGVSSGGGSLGGISFGLAVYTFDVPIIPDLRAMFEARVKSLVEARVRELVATGTVTPPNLEALATQAAAEVKAQLLAEANRKLLERPRFGLILEGVRVMSPDGWQARLGASYGIGPISLGFGAAIQRAAGETTPITGAELGVRLTPVGRLRTPVLELYTRLDVGFDDGDHPTLLVVGGRALLDLL